MLDNLIKFKLHTFYEISKTYFDQTALHIAIEKGNIDIVKLLLSSKDIDISIKSILIKSIYIILNSIPIIKFKIFLS